MNGPRVVPTWKIHCREHEKEHGDHLPTVIYGYFSASSLHYDLMILFLNPTPHFVIQILANNFLVFYFDDTFYACSGKNFQKRSGLKNYSDWIYLSDNSYYCFLFVFVCLFVCFQIIGKRDVLWKRIDTWCFY